jgi:hypothetical protein
MVAGGLSGGQVVGDGVAGCALAPSKYAQGQVTVIHDVNDCHSRRE